MSHVFRCNACRTRNTWQKALHLYVRGRKCRNCGHTRFYVDKERINRPTCNCLGYHYVHRPGSPCCESNPRSALNQAIRAGYDPTCPF